MLPSPISAFYISFLSFGVGTDHGYKFAYGDPYNPGSVWTATAHAVTAVIGSGVLALPWSVAQMGWILGPLVLVGFASITFFTAVLLSDCYRTPDPVKGRRNYTYMDAVRACLGARDVVACGIIQYLLLWGVMVGYTITAAMSMKAVKSSDCYHRKGEEADCRGTGTGSIYLIIFGATQIVLSQFPSLEKVTFLSVVAAAMAFAYSFIALYLSLVKLIAINHGFGGSLTGVKIDSISISPSTKLWNSFQALGNIAFAYTYAMLLIEIQDTLKSPPPENKTMKTATMYGIGISTLFYVSLGCVGYGAFGNVAPGNVLTGFHEPFWLVHIANLAVIVHLAGAYQVYAQPVFAFYEKWLGKKWPSSLFFHRVHALRLPFSRDHSFQFTFSKLILRTIFIVFTTLVAMMLPFFNAIVGLLGAIAFWPLTVYFPITMYIAQAKITRGSCKWMVLQSLSMFALLVSLLAALGSIADIADRLKHARLLKIAF